MNVTEVNTSLYCPLYYDIVNFLLLDGASFETWI